MRRTRLIAAVGALLLTMPLLSGCSSPPDPQVAREALSEVTADPTPPEAESEYDVSVSPDPIVEPIECSPYLVITARGTGEPSRGQLLGPVVRAISDARPDEVEHLDIDYPADTDVREGGTYGARFLIDTLNVQAEACPEQGFILLGYSQGALVIGDALGKPEYRLVGATVGEVSDEASERILGIVFYGNPRFNGEATYSAGTFDTSLNGLLPRPNGGLDRYAEVTRDYCVARDFICQSSLDLHEEGHVAYYENGMQQDGAAFIITLLPPIVESDDEDESAEGETSDSADTDSNSADNNDDDSSEGVG